MKSFLILGVILPLILNVTIGCSPLRKTIVEYKTEIIKKDSLLIRDSTVVIPVERVVDIVPAYDTLILETSLARSESYVDTVSHILRGKIENKNTFSHQIKYTIKTVVRDSLVYKPEPYPVEVKVKNKVNGFLLGWFICSILAIVAFILKKFHILL